MEYDSNMGRLLRILDRYDFLDFYLTTIPDDFKQRAKKIQKYTNIFVLSKEDIILSKIGRYAKKDIEDITILMDSADKELIQQLIEKVLSRENMSKRVREAFVANLKLFREQFHV